MSALAARETLACVFPLVLLMRERAQPAAGVPTVALENSRDGVALRLREILGVPGRPRLNLEQLSVLLVEIGNNGTIGPCLDPRVKQRLFVLDDMPRLAVVDELLQLPRRHLAAVGENFCGYVVNTGHVAPQSRTATYLPSSRTKRLSGRRAASRGRRRDIPIRRAADRL